MKYWRKKDNSNTNKMIDTRLDYDHRNGMDYIKLNSKRMHDVGKTEKETKMKTVMMIINQTNGSDTNKNRK